jgi:hypothetical protein
LNDPHNTIATPTLHALLDGLQARLRRSVLLHGLGTLLAVVTLWTFFAFLGDWLLRVPGPVRLMHAAALVALIAYFLRRDLLGPLSRLPDRTGLALLIERQHPALHELLVSAVQLQEQKSHGNAAPALIASVMQEAEAQAKTLSIDSALDPVGPRRRIQLGFATLTGVLVLAFVFPLQARTFLARVLGSGPNWPQRTYLSVEVPDLGEGTEVQRGDELISVRVARGTDIPVVVRATGVVPDEVILHFEGGRDLILNPTGAGLFRTLLRSLQDDVSFHVTGGDDQDGLPLIVVEVLQPPDIEGLAISVTPPEYTNLPAELIFDRDAEALAGSQIRVVALVSPGDAQGSARLMPEDRVLKLSSMEFPADPARGDAPPMAALGLGFDLVADRSIGFRIELVDAKGLSNPDPGLFRLQVVEDRAPEVQVLEPARGEIEVVLGGALPLRARVSDDFGLRTVSWEVLNNNGDEAVSQQVGAFSLFPIRPEDGEQSERARERALASVRLEVSSLAGPEGIVAADQRYEIMVKANDNRSPEANEGRSFPIRVRVVTPEELLRRLQDRLGQARLSAMRLSELQGEKRARTEEIFAALDFEDAALDRRALSSAIAGQRRVISDSRALAQELAAIASDVLYARIEEKAEALLEAYDSRVSSNSSSRFRPEPWREVAATIADGGLSDAGFASNLVTLVDRALVISEDDTTASANALAQAEAAVDIESSTTALTTAIERQDEALRHIEELIDDLAQWNNFQDVLQLTRDILNRQRTLRERTEKFARENDR